MSSVTYVACEACNRLNKIPLDRTGTPECGACHKALSVHDGIVEATPTSLKPLLEKSPLPVVVDFWAPWCGPCRQFAPAFSSAAKELAGKVVFVKANTEAYPALGQAFNVRGIPTLTLHSGGKEIARQSGAMPLPMFLQWLRTTAPGV